MPLAAAQAEDMDEELGMPYHPMSSSTTRLFSFSVLSAHCAQSGVSCERRWRRRAADRSLSDDCEHESGDEPDDSSVRRTSTNPSDTCLRRRTLLSPLKNVSVFVGETIFLACEYTYILLPACSKVQYMRVFEIQMSNLEDKLTRLKKKKLTAKTIVDAQRRELRVLKSSSSLKERLEEIYQRFDHRQAIDHALYQRIVSASTDEPPATSPHDWVQCAVDDLTNLLGQLQRLLAIETNVDWQRQPLNVVVDKQKECLKVIQWKLADLYAHRVADEVSCITS